MYTMENVLLENEVNSMRDEEIEFYLSNYEYGLLQKGRVFMELISIGRKPQTEESIFV